jgi:hypothetical protein
VGLQQIKEEEDEKGDISVQLSENAHSQMELKFVGDDIDYSDRRSEKQYSERHKYVKPPIEFIREYIPSSHSHSMVMPSEASSGSKNS